jgi:hypothetical protein
MVAFYASDTALGVNLSERTTGTSTAFVGAKFTPGQVIDGSNGSKWMYVQASAAIGANDYICVDEAFSASAGTKANVDAGYSIAFAAGTAFAQYDMGWVCVQARNSGVAVNVAAGTAADVALYTSGTAGQLDDNSTSQTKIEGIVAVSAADATTKTAVGCIITFPRGL